ncbi:arginine N-succinyltransferase [Marinobacter sp. C2H3]|uniref:arginine N-succinyltransferase n=1 Tax=Marinobacter sp. C2H3 TaxID=3119003 RepID=UPI00300EDABD
MLIRPVEPRDLDALYDIAVESGPGFTSLMPDRGALAAKVAHAQDSLARPVGQPADEHYLFVLEDPDTGAVIGTTAIEAAAGHRRPLSHFHRRSRASRPGEDALVRGTRYTGCTEICSLYLRPAFRHGHAGRLLSRVRFLFMAQHPERFATTVIAEMRGVSDDQGRSPFWDWLRPQVADLSFAEVTRLSDDALIALLRDRMPAGPLPIRFMTAGAQAVIGQVHPQTRPALHLLEQEGFRFRGYVDLFDAGPTVEAPLAGIRSVRHSRPMAITATGGQPGHGAGADQPVVVANTSVTEFRALITHQRADDLARGRLVLAPSVLARLGLADSRTAWALPIGPARPATRHTIAGGDHRHAQ